MARYDTLMTRPVLKLRRMLRAGGRAALLLDDSGQLMVRRDPDAEGAILVAVYEGDVDDEQLLEDIASARVELSARPRHYVRTAA
jgi:hypothetical protein